MNAARLMAIPIVLAAVMGLLFSWVSTYDFVQHLDRQMHTVHCSIIPGMVGSGAEATSSCQTVLMSNWSSVLRQWVWGGIPVSLPGIGFFAFLAALGVSFAFAEEREQRMNAGFLVLASLIPSLASLVLGFVSLAVLGTLCTVCAGIYVSSFALTLATFVALVAAPRPGDDEDEDDEDDDFTSMGTLARLGLAAVVGFACVVGPVSLYVILVPDYTRFIAGCGTLSEPADPEGVLVSLHPQEGGPVAIEVFDPLCPSCRALETRLTETAGARVLDRKLLLFPLDSSCNWMLTRPVHPGACAISEAILCAGDDAREVVVWGWENRERIMQSATEGGDEAVLHAIGVAFPALRGCLGSSDVRVRLNGSLRWAVQNQIEVLTPQLFIDGVRLCEEDSDLGLEFALTRLLHARAPEAPP